MIKGELLPRIPSRPASAVLRPGSPADLRRAGEGDQRHIGIIDQRITHGRATTGDHTEVLHREPGVEQHPGQVEGGQRGLARGLDDDGAAGGDRRSDLVGDQVQGKLNGLMAPTTPMGTRRTIPR